MVLYRSILTLYHCVNVSARNERLKAEEASFRQAREQLLEDLERRVKKAKAALAAASTTLKKEKNLAQV